MMASIGWIISEAGITFPGMISQHPPLAFADLGRGYAAWEAVPMAGKAQIFAAAGLIEAASELKKPVRNARVDSRSVFRHSGGIGTQAV